jgi:hypothetical protein
VAYELIGEKSPFWLSIVLLAAVAVLIAFGLPQAGAQRQASALQK